MKFASPFLIANSKAFAALGFVASLMPAQATADVEITVGSAHIPGVTCVSITYDCPEPAFVEISMDSTVIESYTPGFDILTVPRSRCFEESYYGSGTHLIEVEADCGVSSPDISNDSVTPTFLNPPVGLSGVENEELACSSGDTVTFIAHLQAEDLDLAVDFGAIDSQYTLGDEIVTDLGGGDYEVEYTLSAENTRVAGEYRLPIEISDGNATRTYDDAVLLWYTPTPTGVIEFQDVASGDFVHGNMPEGTLGSVGLNSVSVEINSVPGAVAVVTANLWSYGNIDGTALIVNVREEGTAGYAASEVWISGSTCLLTSVLCVAEIEIPLKIRPSRIDDVDDEDELGIEMSLGLYTSGGPSFTAAIPLPDPWIVDKQPANTISMVGRLAYHRMRQVGKPNPMDERHPQFASVTLAHELLIPLRRVTVQVSDTCSHTYTTETNKNGTWHIYVPKQCEDATYTVTAKPLTSFGVYRVRTWDFDDVVASIEIGSADVPGTSKHWGTTHFETNASSYGLWATFNVGLQVQEWAKPFLVGDAKVSSFPWLNFSFEAGEVADADCGNTSCYSVGTQEVHVGGAAINQDERDEWALLHESFHWFQDMFMAKLDGNGDGSPAWAGAFGEGFASMMPSILRGDHWVILSSGGMSSAEDLDFQGNFTEAGSIEDNWFPALPFDLYATTVDKGAGGWSWRILWDFFDDSDSEPETEFARFDTDGSGKIGVSSPDTQLFGPGFDEIGTAAMFEDVIVRYLGGNHMPSNTFRPPLNSQGGEGLDMTEFLDGMLCRGHLEWEDMEPIVLDMMSFQAYDEGSAPLSCP